MDSADSEASPSPHDSGLRRRGWAPATSSTGWPNQATSSSGYRPRVGAGVWDGDDDDEGLEPTGRFAGASHAQAESTQPQFVSPPSWHMTAGLIVGTVVWLQQRVPDEASLKDFVVGQYGRPPPAKIGRFMLGDRSYSKQPDSVQWSRKVLLALGSTNVTLEGFQYEHSYLGIAGKWFALPYLPRVRLKGKAPSFRYGLGLCYSARCVCVPDKKAPCRAFVFNTSSLLSLVLGLNIGLFLTSFVTYENQAFALLYRLQQRCRLSWQTVLEGRLLPLLLSPFAHTSLFEFGRNMALLASLIEPCGAHGVFLFLALYIGGSWVHFLGSCLSAMLFGPEWTLWQEATIGCRGGLSSLLALLSWVGSDQRFRFGLYFVEVPTPLSPLATLAANAAVDAAFGMNRGRGIAELLGHLLALLWGWALSVVFVP